MFDLPKLRVAVTRECQMRCIYCPRGSSVSMENYNGHTSKSLNTEELYEVLSVLVASGIKTVHFTGGEPLRRDDIACLVSKTKALGTSVELNTNGVDLTAAKALELKESGLDLLKVSFDTPDNQSFKEMTGLDMFDLVHKNIKQAIDILPVRLNCVVLRRNLPFVLQLIRMADSMGAPAIHFLDLTYYPWEGAIDFFEKEFVDLTVTIRPMLEAEFGKTFINMNLRGCHFSEMVREEGKTRVVLKEADLTMRNRKVCDQCPTYCHEGIFTIRMSVDGYMNFCPCVNSHGIDALQSARNGQLVEVMAGYSETIEAVRPIRSFSHFLTSNGILLDGGSK